MKTYQISLVGNPNVGKTTLYNKLTHSFEHIGNWHGITVDIASKSFLYKHSAVLMNDLPGFYSMSTVSFEEAVSRNELLKRKDDIVINVCDVNNLVRNLYLTLQLIELKIPVVVAVNMIDELKLSGRSINCRALEGVLGVPVVPISAKYHSDVHLLLDIAISEAQRENHRFIEPIWLERLPIDNIEKIIGESHKKTGESSWWCALKLLENDAAIEQALELSGASLAKINEIRAGEDYESKVAQARFEHISKLMEGIITENVGHEHFEMKLHEKYNLPIESVDGHSDGTILMPEQHLATEGGAARLIRIHNKSDEREKKSRHGFKLLDTIVLNNYLALPIFLLIMLAIFWATFGPIGLFFSGGLEWLFVEQIGGAVQSFLNNNSFPDWLGALLVDGIIGGVGGVLTFLPQIVLLFFFLAFMEDTGYLTRVAFVTDGIFRRFGLTGRSVFTMLMGFGCTATAVLTARNQDDKMTKIKTILLTPFMSCGARMPIYAAIGAAYFSGGSILVIFSLYLIGVLTALLWALVLEKNKRFKSGKPSFIMEMPPYRLPTLARVCSVIGNNVLIYLKRVATVVFAMTTLIWFMGNFSITLRYVGEGGDSSMLQSIAGLISPIFAPMGYGSWEAAAALLSGLVAKEAVISSLEALGIGSVDILFTGAYPKAAAFAFLVFTLLYIPCVAAISSMLKELGKKWTLISMGMQIGTAYVFSLIAYWLAVLAYAVDWVWVVALLIFLTIMAYSLFVLIRLIKTKDKCSTCAINSACNKRVCQESQDDEQNTKEDDKGV